MNTTTADPAAAPAGVRKSRPPEGNVAPTCRICGRGLLMGERVIVMVEQAAAGTHTVCVLCRPRAAAYGLRPRPTHDAPVVVVRTEHRRRWRTFIRSTLARRRPAPDIASSFDVPLGVKAIPVAIDRFNASEHVRMLAGLIRTLGQPRVSVVSRSSIEREVVITVAWDIVWYQYRVRPDRITSARGTWLRELSPRWREWNASVTPGGMVTAVSCDEDSRRTGPAEPVSDAPTSKGVNP